MSDSEMSSVCSIELLVDLTVLQPGTTSKCAGHLIYHTISISVHFVTADYHQQGNTSIMDPEFNTKYCCGKPSNNVIYTILTSI